MLCRINMLAVDVVVLPHGRTASGSTARSPSSPGEPWDRRGHRPHLRRPRRPGRDRVAQARGRRRGRRVDREGARQRSRPRRRGAHRQGRRVRPPRPRGDRRASARSTSSSTTPAPTRTSGRCSAPRAAPGTRRSTSTSRATSGARARSRATSRREARRARSSTSRASRASSASPLQGIYAMTKAAVISMTKTLALELGPSRIRVNAIAPGFVDTRLASAILKNDELRQGRARANAARPLRHARRDRRRRAVPRERRCKLLDWTYACDRRRVDHRLGGPTCSQQVGERSEGTDGDGSDDRGQVPPEPPARHGRDGVRVVCDQRLHRA